MSVAKNVALIALGAAGAVVAVNQLAQPSTSTSSPSLASLMRRKMDEYNSTIHPEQDRSDTLFDRTALMENVKTKKPWNRTYAEKERAKHE